MLLLAKLWSGLALPLNLHKSCAGSQEQILVETRGLSGMRQTMSPTLEVKCEARPWLSPGRHVISRIGEGGLQPQSSVLLFVLSRGLQMEIPNSVCFVMLTGSKCLSSFSQGCGPSVLHHSLLFLLPVTILVAPSIYKKLPYHLAFALALYQESSVIKCSDFSANRNLANWDWVYVIPNWE